MTAPDLGEWSTLVIYELRTYWPAPGKMPALHRRFRDHTLRLFDKHGIKVVGFWETYIGPGPSLVYILGYEDLGHRQRAWDSFSNDPEWIAAREESERDGPLLARIESSILKGTPYGPNA
jgi:hypothetical protein